MDYFPIREGTIISLQNTPRISKATVDKFDGVARGETDDANNTGFEARGPTAVAKVEDSTPPVSRSCAIKRAGILRRQNPTRGRKNTPILPSHLHCRLRQGAKVVGGHPLLSPSGWYVYTEHYRTHPPLSTRSEMPPSTRQTASKQNNDTHGDCSFGFALLFVFVNRDPARPPARRPGRHHFARPPAPTTRRRPLPPLAAAMRLFAASDGLGVLPLTSITASLPGSAYVSPYVSPSGQRTDGRTGTRLLR